MIVGLSEFDESAPPPTGGPVTATGERPERPTCRVVRCSTVYVCTLPHCAVCDGHFDPGKHTEATLCERCYDWQKLETRMSPEQLAELRAIAARRAPPDIESGVLG